MVGSINVVKGVSIHGYSLHAPNFEEVIWGIPPDRPGRLPKGVAIFLEQEAKFLSIGTGATKREGDGKLEAEVIAEYLFDHFGDLVDFTCIRELLAQKWRHAKEHVEESLLLAVKCKNTQEELEEVGGIFEGLGTTHWVLVSSSDHISRVAKIAATLSLERIGALPWSNIEVAWSPVPYGMGPDKILALDIPPGSPDIYVDFLGEVGPIANMLRLGDPASAHDRLLSFLARIKQEKRD